MYIEVQIDKDRKGKRKLVNLPDRLTIECLVAIVFDGVEVFDDYDYYALPTGVSLSYGCVIHPYDKLILFLTKENDNPSKKKDCSKTNS